jgi:hypothetical protein
MAAVGESQPGRRGTWTATYVLLLLISVGLMVLASVLGRSKTLAVDLLNELGIAGFVAFVLALTIERLSAKEFERRAESERSMLKQEFRDLAEKERAAIKKDVFYQTYGRILPQAIRDELENQFLQADFVRSYLYLKFDLTIVNSDANEHYVKSNCLSISHIDNLSDKHLTFPIGQEIDASPSDALQNEVKFLEFDCTGSAAKISLNESQLAAMTRRDAGSVALTLPDDKPVVVLPEQPTVMRVRYQGIRVMDGGGIYFSFTTHTCDLELTVHVINRDLDVFAEAYSPQQLAETDAHNPATGYYNWKIKKPLLAHQAIRVTWHRPSAPTQQQAQTTPAPAPAAPAPPAPSSQAPADPA